MSKAKAISKEKEKGVELKDVEDTDRPRTTYTRSTLTLKLLPKIDPKDKGNCEEIQGNLRVMKKVARKVQDEWEAEEEKTRLSTFFLLKIKQ
ncbi:hypothetical protein Tco_0755123 [Tanacetum coccineum]